MVNPTVVKILQQEFSADALNLVNSTAVEIFLTGIFSRNIKFGKSSQNCHWKLEQQVPSVGSNYLGLFRDSQNFNSFSVFRQFFYRLSDWFEILWGFTKFFFKQMLKISAFYLEKQKKIIPKKAKSELASISKQSVCLLTQFSATVMNKGN